jgi:hypothetical protein
MSVHTPSKLREAAKEFREMAPLGDDIRLQAALLLVADEFEAEAVRLEGLTDQAASRDRLFQPHPSPGPRHPLSAERRGE